MREEAISLSVIPLAPCQLPEKYINMSDYTDYKYYHPAEFVTAQSNV